MGFLGLFLARVVDEQRPVIGQVDVLHGRVVVPLDDAAGECRPDRLCLAHDAATGNVDLWVIAGITIVVKAVLLPWLLIWVVKRLNIPRDIEPVIPINVTLACAAGIVVLAFHLSASLGSVRQAITGNALPVGIALILLGILVMASRRKALMQMVGLFASENGIFFTAMAISQGMPLIIEIGVILDVVLGALVMGILVLRVRSSVDTDIADLEDLKG